MEVQMDRYRAGYKETYEQIDSAEKDTIEFNMINPYAEMANSIKFEHKDAVITKAKTTFEWHCLPLDPSNERKLTWIQVPMLAMFYEVANERA
jgi:hypothetical protein